MPLVLLKLLEALLIGYLPGALLVRLPTAGRRERAALPAEERVFLAVVLSVALSSMLTLMLGAVEIYSFSRLLGALSGLCVVLTLGSGFNLRLGPAAPRPGRSAIVPVGIVAMGLWLYFPPAEWVIGGRDPGVYTNEGVRIAQTGSLKIADPVVAALPPELWELVIPPAEMGYRKRFMGFSVEDPKAGTVIGQFPHLFPASMAIGYGLDGLTGVRRATGVWGILGVLAVYFAGSMFFGRTAAAAGAGLLSLHVAQVWFARSPYAELPMQALLFTALYAYARLEKGGSAFFGIVAANLLGVIFFLRVDAMIVFATVAAALLLDAAVGRKVRWYFSGLLVCWACAGWTYLAVFVRPYLQMPIGFVENLTPLHWLFILVGGASGGTLLIWLRRRGTSPPRWLPTGIVLAVAMGAGYAYFLRQPGGLLAAHDAYALRSFTANYFAPYLLAAAVIGFVVVGPRVFWTHTWMMLLVSVFSAFFFYKIRIVPEHFWVARRFLPVILPGMLLFAGAAFFTSLQSAAGRAGRAVWLSRARHACGLVVIGLAASQFYQQTKPVLPHVEYADIIPRLEALAAHIHDDDLLVVESRGGSDIHVLALPLAYIYAKHVVVLSTDEPVPTDVMTLFEWGSRRYARVLYLGSGGSKLLCRAIDAEFLRSESIWVPEYDRSADHVPTTSRQKAFVFSLFRLVPLKALPPESRVDVGVADELTVSRFHSREQSGERRFRWSTAHSVIWMRMSATAPSKVIVWMGNGGRPASAPPATVGVFAGRSFLGYVDVSTDESRPYEFSLPPEAVAEAAQEEGFVVIHLNVPTWNPAKVLGSSDTRNVGVMVTRAELR